MADQQLMLLVERCSPASPGLVTPKHEGLQGSLFDVTQLWV